MLGRTNTWSPLLRPFLISTLAKSEIPISTQERVGPFEEFLKTINSNSFDNIVISHVFAFITGDNYEKTIELRNLIINELIRISKKTVFINPGNKTLKKIAKPTINLARQEGLEAHALSVEIRQIKT